jgi:hypothetical protein
MKTYGKADVQIHVFLEVVVTFTPWPLYPRLGGAQSRSVRREKEKILDPTGT